MALQTNNWSELTEQTTDVSRLFSPRHHGTLDMPARPAGPPGTLPAGLSWLRFLPEGKVSLRPLLTGGGAKVSLTF